MKKLFLVLALISGLAFTANAQDFGFKKGNVFLEGNIGLNSTNNKNTEQKESSFTFTPKAGYFVTDKIAIGVELHFSTEKTEDYTAGAETLDKDNIFGAGVFGRYYFLELGKRFKTYAEAGVGYGSLKNENKVGTAASVETKANVFGVNAGVGANYFLTERIAINAGLTNVINFSSIKADAPGAKTVSSFGLNAGSINNLFDIATFGLTFKF